MHIIQQKERFKKKKKKHYYAYLHYFYNLQARLVNQFSTLLRKAEKLTLKKKTVYL